MSADSFIPLAIAGAFFFAAPIVIAGLAVAGAAAAVSVVAQTAADASRKAAAEQASRQREQQARLARQSAEDQQAIRALQSRYTALQSRQRAAADALSQNIAQAAQKAARELHASGKATAENAASLQRTAQAKAEALSHKWSTQNDALLAQYSADLHASFQETRTQLEARKADLSRLHSTLAGDDAQTRRLAQEQLDTARIAIQSFEVEFGRSPAAEDYHRAVEYFNGGLYENAHSLASAVALDVYTQLEKALVQQAKDDFLRTAIGQFTAFNAGSLHFRDNRQDRLCNLVVVDTAVAVGEDGAGGTIKGANHAAGVRGLLEPAIDVCHQQAGVLCPHPLVVGSRDLQLQSQLTVGIFVQLERGVADHEVKVLVDGGHLHSTRCGNVVLFDLGLPVKLNRKLLQTSSVLH